MVEDVVRAQAALMMVKRAYEVSMKEVGCSTVCVHGVASTAVKEVATADAASEVEVAEKCQLHRQPWRP
jgi:hypothetical protein